VLPRALVVGHVLGIVVEPLCVVVAGDEPESEGSTRCTGSEARSAWSIGIGFSAPSIWSKGSVTMSTSSEWSLRSRVWGVPLCSVNEVRVRSSACPPMQRNPVGRRSSQPTSIAGARSGWAACVAFSAADRSGARRRRRQPIRFRAVARERRALARDARGGMP
jgi:hypothetical protein